MFLGQATTDTTKEPALILRPVRSPGLVAADGHTRNRGLSGTLAPEGL